ncbi:MAG: DNA polymerase III subunit delta, partial [Sulfuriferula sp.]
TYRVWLVLALAISSLTAGCGFQLRGQADIPYSSVYVDGNPGSSLVINLQRIIRMLEGLKQEGEAPTLVLWTLTRELRILTRLKTAQANGIRPASIMREIGVWEARQSLVERALDQVKLDALTHALHQTAAIDRMIKGWEQGDPWAALQRLALTVAIPNKTLVAL